jgi:hypothetical protein
LFVLVGLLSAIFFVLGGMGIREGSWPAAAIVFIVYLLQLFGSASTCFP